VSLPAEPIEIEGDRVRLAQVLGNLLNNAAKYAGPGAAIDLAAVTEGDQLVVRVRDSGAGISPDLLPHVFDMFAKGDLSGDRASGGLGIGLALVRQLVGLHGGTVEARSEGRGRGSEFIVRFPLAIGSRPPSSPAPAVRPSGQRVLVVDDNHDSADSLSAILQLSGFETRVAYGGPAALEVLATFTPTAAVLDIGMPEMDGYELARRIRAQLPSITLVAVTGWGQADDRRRSSDAGFDHHLTKPVRAQVLATLLTSAGAHPDGGGTRPPQARVRDQPG
jgi:CheY-like chemotaxis protein/anti-sigma regulatory factor (Ser/Thr protein kinase)